jgi:hypothetical protein
MYSDQMRNVDQLVSALSGLSKAAGQYEAKQQALVDQEARVMQDATSVGYDAQTGGTGGGFLRMFTGSGRPSPSAMIDIDQRQGLKAFGEALLKDKEYQTLMTRSDIWENPDEARKQFAAITERVRREHQETNPGRSPYFYGGWSTADRAARERADAASLTSFVQSTQKRNSDDMMTEAQNAVSSGRLPLQERASVIAREANVDPAKIHQFVSIENEGWNPNATSPTGVRGLTQTTNDRFNEIKARIAQTNPELAARMKDRTDPESSLIALTSEIPRMEQAAQGILGRTPTTAETYLFWNLGMGGGAQLTRAIAAGKLDAKVGDVVTDMNAINGNAGLYGRNGSKTVGEAMNEINQRMKVESPFHARSLPVNQMRSVVFTESTGIPEGSTRFNYKWSDFKNSGVQGGTGRLDSRIINVLDQASQLMGYKIMPTSGHRSGEYQNQQGIKSGSHGPHTTGTALDIDVKDPEKQLKLVRFFSSIGVTGIGVYGSHMHIDLVNREASWSKDGAKLTNEQVKQAIAEGKQDASNGGYYRVAGYQGTSMSPFQSQVAQYNSRYGLGYAQTRQNLLSVYSQAAENAALTGSPVQASQMLSDILTNYGEGMTGAERNTLLNKQTQVFDIAQRVAQQEAALERMQADRWERSQYSSILAAQEKGERPQIDRSAAPKTRAGQEASARLESLALAPIADPSISNDTMRTLNLRLNDKELYRELGYEGDSRPSNALEFRDKVLKAYSGKINLGDLNTLTERWEQKRTSDPLSSAFAERSLTVNRANIVDAFTNNREALNVLMTIGGARMEGMSPEQLTKDYTDRMMAFYRQNYMELYREAAESMPIGSDPDATMRERIEQKALQNTTAYGRSMANIIMATKGDMKGLERTPRITQITDPTTAINAILRSRGEPIPDGVAGVPKGSRLSIRSDGQPVVTGDGSYEMVLPSGQKYYYNPYFAANQAAPNMARTADTRDEMEAAATRQASGQPAPTTPQQRGETPTDRRVSTYTQRTEQMRTQREQEAAQRQTEREQGAREAVTRTFNNAVLDSIRKSPEIQGMSKKIEDAKTEREALQIADQRDARVEEMRQGYIERMKPLFDAFQAARTALDKAPAGQREAARRAYQAALAAWEESQK